MAHPKRRQSKTRTAKRRTHDKAVAPTLAICPNCGAWHVYHTVCGACGYYRGQLAIEKEAALYYRKEALLNKCVLFKECSRRAYGSQAVFL